MKVKVIINNKAYEMDRSKLKGMLDIGKENVKKGIYALEKNGTVLMRRDIVESNTKLKEMIRTYKAQGYKVYANK